MRGDFLERGWERGLERGRICGAQSEVSGPFAGGVEDAEDLDGVGADAVGEDVGGVGDDEFAGAWDAAGAAHGGIRGEQVGGAEDFLDETAGGGGIVFGDIGGSGFEVGQSYFQPLNAHGATTSWRRALLLLRLQTRRDRLRQGLCEFLRFANC